jgi:hypothetical protein
MHTVHTFSHLAIAILQCLRRVKDHEARTEERVIKHHANSIAKSKCTTNKNTTVMKFILQGTFPKQDLQDLHPRT